MTDNILPTLQTDSTPADPNGLLFLSDAPAKIATYLNSRKAPAPSEPDAPAAIPYSFADFVSEMTMTDFTDDYQIRATLESQEHLLGTAFNYLMIEGDWKNLKHILRTQKVMRDTINLMNTYPPLTGYGIPNHIFDRNTAKTDAPMD